ncbi:MAG: NAD-dependent dehydratase [Chloroflexi bacterium]|nr:MAG: NAD-dependent dehydratase [Chloroflexota bacterium]
MQDAIPEADVGALRVVVTGAGGFIGGHVVRSLCALAGVQVVAVDLKPLDAWFQRLPNAENVVADVSDRATCYRLLDGAEQVYNFAADMGGMGFIEQHKALCMLSVLMNTHLLLAARDLGVQRFFFASSACVYPQARQDRVDQPALRESDAYPADPEDGYGWEKLFSERMCRHFQEDFGLECRVARYHNIYGPLGTYAGGREKAPAAICRKIAEAQLNGRRSIEVWGDGKQQRSFTYIDDAVDGTLRLMASPVSDPLNIGSDEMVSIDDLVTLVEEVAGYRVQRRYNLGAPVGVRSRTSDNTQVCERLGWAPTTPLAVGIEPTYRWVYDQVARGRQLGASA